MNRCAYEKADRLHLQQRAMSTAREQMQGAFDSGTQGGSREKGCKEDEHMGNTGPVALAHPFGSTPNCMATTHSARSDLILGEVRMRKLHARKARIGMRNLAGGRQHTWDISRSARQW